VFTYLRFSEVAGSVLARLGRRAFLTGVELQFIISFDAIVNHLSPKNVTNVTLRETRVNDTFYELQTPAPHFHFRIDY
jgi:hypothetical protein